MKKKIIIYSSNICRCISVLNSLENKNLDILQIISNKSNFEKEIRTHKKVSKALNFINIKQTSINKIFDFIKSFNIDLAIIAGFTTIVDSKLINAPKLGTINLHGGPIPDYLGGSVLNWQIINGEKFIGVTILKTLDGIDNGPVIAESFFELQHTDTIKEVHSKANYQFSQLLESKIKSILKDNINYVKKNTEKLTYWHQRNFENGKINWSSLNSTQVFNLVRAISDPYPNAFCFSPNDKIIKIKQVSILKRIIKGFPGQVLFLDGDGPFVVCSDNAIKIDKYSSEDKIKLKSGMILK